MDDHLEQKPVVANIDGRATEISETRLRGPERGRRLTWHWYWVDGRIVASPAVAKLLQAKAKLLGRDQRAAAIALSTNEGIDPEEARRAMQTLLAGASFLTRMLNDAQPLAATAARAVKHHGHRHPTAGDVWILDEAQSLALIQIAEN